MGKILNFGSLNIDRVYRVEHFVRPGETISSRGYQCFPGGKGLNQSIALARAGAPVFHAGTVGTDGDFLAELLRESGADIRYVRKTDGMTGHALIQVNDEGENCIILYQGTNFDNDTAYMEQVEEAALYETGVTAEPGGQLLTLSTCSYHTADGRFVVVAVRVD